MPPLREKIPYRQKGLRQFFVPLIGIVLPQILEDIEHSKHVHKHLTSEIDTILREQEKQKIINELVSVQQTTFFPEKPYVEKRTPLQKKTTLSQRKQIQGQFNPPYRYIPPPDEIHTELFTGSTSSFQYVSSLNLSEEVIEIKKAHKDSHVEIIDISRLQAGSRGGTSKKPTHTPPPKHYTQPSEDQDKAKMYYLKSKNSDGEKTKDSEKNHSYIPVDFDSKKESLKEKELQELKKQQELERKQKQKELQELEKQKILERKQKENELKELQKQKEAEQKLKEKDQKEKEKQKVLQQKKKEKQRLELERQNELSQKQKQKEQKRLEKLERKRKKLEEKQKKKQEKQELIEKLKKEAEEKKQLKLKQKQEKNQKQPLFSTSTEEKKKTQQDTQDSEKEKKDENTEPMETLVLEKEEKQQIITIEEQEEEVLSHPQEIQTPPKPSGVDDDLIKVLLMTDELLGKLPDEVIEKFAQSDDFLLYEKVLSKYKSK